MGEALTPKVGKFANKLFGVVCTEFDGDRFASGDPIECVVCPTQ